VQSVSFSPNGKQLASASWDQTIRLWNLSNLGALPQVLSTPSDRLAGISSVAFSPDGTRLASGTWDQEVQIWDLLQPKAKPIVLMGHHGYVHSVAFSPDGGLLASGSEDESVRLWPIWQRAAETVCMRVWRNLSMEEWKFYIGEGIPYERTCPNLPPGAGAPQ
jgi:WD40 repeat protein